MHRSWNAADSWIEIACLEAFHGPINLRNYSGSIYLAGVGLPPITSTPMNAHENHTVIDAKKDIDGIRYHLAARFSPLVSFHNYRGFVKMCFV